MSSLRCGYRERCSWFLLCRLASALERLCVLGTAEEKVSNLLRDLEKAEIRKCVPRCQAGWTHLSACSCHAARGFSVRRGLTLVCRLPTLRARLTGERRSSTRFFFSPRACTRAVAIDRPVSPTEQHSPISRTKCFQHFPAYPLHPTSTSASSGTAHGDLAARKCSQ